MLIASAFPSEHSFAASEEIVSQCIAGTKYSHIYGEGVEDWEIQDETSEYCREALASNPEDEAILFGYARILRKEGNFKDAFLILRQLEAKNHIPALLELSDFYDFGLGQPQNIKADLAVTRKAYQLGSADAALYLSYIYFNGTGVDASTEEYKTFLEEAVAKSSSSAVLQLAENLIDGRGDYEVDLERAKTLLLREIKLGHTEAEIEYLAINLKYPETLSEFQFAYERMLFLANDAWSAARFHIAMNNIGLSAEDLLDLEKLGFKADYEVGFNQLNELLDNESVWLASDMFVPELAERLSEKQITEIINKLDKLANEVDLGGYETASTAAWTLVKIFKNGIFGPVDVDKQAKYLKLLAETYQDRDASSELGWLFYAEIDLFDIDAAISFTTKALSSELPHIVAYSHNNLGTMKAWQKNFSDAYFHFEKAVQIGGKTDYNISAAYDNLLRMEFILSNEGDLNLEKLRHLASKSSEIGDNDFFREFLARYPFSKNTKPTEVKNWLYKELQRGNYIASLELAFFDEHFDDMSNSLKWYEICSVMCPDDMQRTSVDRINKYKMSLRGSLFSQAKRDARDWLLENASFLASSDDKNVFAENSRNNSIKKIVSKGNFLALLIGVSKYDNLHNLATPINDIYKIGGVLEQKYAATTTYLTDPRRSDITAALNKLKKNASIDDSILIYYAGHGELDSTTKEGYWLPKDADIDDDTNWISNNYVRDKIKSFQARNVLLVADSCFSGSIIQRSGYSDVKDLPQSAIEKYMMTPSRVVITSGGVKPVLDGGGGDFSIFAESFIDVLTETKTVFTSSELYLEVRDRVTEEAIYLGEDQTPLRGELPNAGHAGPDFVFLPTTN